MADVVDDERHPQRRDHVLQLCDLVERYVELYRPAVRPDPVSSLGQQLREAGFVEALVSSPQVDSDASCAQAVQLLEFPIANGVQVDAYYCSTSPSQLGKGVQDGCVVIVVNGDCHKARVCNAQTRLEPK